MNTQDTGNMGNFPYLPAFVYGASQLSLSRHCIRIACNVIHRVAFRRTRSQAGVTLASDLWRFDIAESRSLLGSLAKSLKLSQQNSSIAVRAAGLNPAMSSTSRKER